MVYKFNLGTGQDLFLDNLGEETVITLTSGNSSQQQSQRSTQSIGRWSAIPSAFQTSSGVVLQLTTEKGEYFFSVQGNQLQSLSQVPVLVESEKLNPEETSLPSMEKMKPMSPMKPMAPMKPMEMRMQGMEMRMGNPSTTGAGKNFCPQCGTPVQTEDKFCANCGHSLT